MRNYEMMLMFRINPEKDAIAQATEEVVELLNNNGGSVTETNVWGRRKLAYPIDNQSEGAYVLLNMSIEPAALQDVEFNLKLNEKLLRHMIVKDESMKTAEVEEFAVEEPVIAEFKQDDDAVAEEAAAEAIAA